MKGVIYKWDNVVTHKSYIGKSLSPKCRYNWFLQFDDHYAGPHIDKARKKYNDKKHWKYSILFSITSNDRNTINDILNTKEIEYISLYKTNNKDVGYNISSGGTFGDTYYALTDDERSKRLKKFHDSQIAMGYKWMYKDGVSIKVPQKEHQSYLDDGWLFGRVNVIPKIIRPPKIKKKKVLSEEHKHHLSISLKNVSNDIAQKRAKIAQENRILYNKSQAHRLSTSESNKRRWKDGCPDSTRKKISESHKGLSKGLIWISKDNISKMIRPDEYQKYINAGWHKGRK